MAKKTVDGRDEAKIVVRDESRRKQWVISPSEGEDGITMRELCPAQDGSVIAYHFTVEDLLELVQAKVRRMPGVMPWHMRGE